MQFLTKVFERFEEEILKPVYKLYEHYLWNQIKDNQMPQHIGIIPDGNRRWAKRHGYEYTFGHKMGYEKVSQVLDWIWNLKVKAVTLYVLSTENCLKRSEEEKQNIFQLLYMGLEQLENDRRIYDSKVKVKIIGNFELIPDWIIKKAKEVEEKTEKNELRILNIAVCYGGRHEIIEAIKKIASDYKKGVISLNEIDENKVSSYLFTSDSPDPDLIIRTSGEERISNFLLWQGAYSELFFTDVYWPEFRKIDLWRAIRSFQKRRRNFGK
ncbi:di-trans,poly-cis-decaprenylcistransferase [Fervidicoccus fontis]|uniref:Tritrans,polycis-undecaprenyl-diphosphate synthase (geranylgeranyl-diphosphate specific) n=1 Tax=Fervidicoccus fontis TaxID=683846 RepID=A0A843A9U0_9CREN|nr:polyprenyl diphosphate synthase [Fervidicoccus fontis]MBE9390592.1 di-trans,poly-cis-decaprenylcistransferase [Fervidicoccus fontis]